MEKDEKRDIQENIKWFRKFSWKERLEIAFRQMKAIKTLKSLTPKPNVKSN